MDFTDMTNHSSPMPIVRAIIENDKGKVLLLRRANTAWGDNAWCLPGGKVDYGQTVAEALVREVFEETALRLQSAKLLILQDSLPTETGGMHCLNLYFHCRVAGELALNEESSTFAWVTASDMSAYDIVFRNDEALRVYFSKDAHQASSLFVCKSFDTDERSILTQPTTGVIFGK
jgi:mutator protein MutT